MKVELQTCGGEFVAFEWILPMDPLPEIILWGERGFTLFPAQVNARGQGVHDGKNPPIYREGLVFGIPAMEMFKEQVQALEADGTLPANCR